MNGIFGIYSPDGFNYDEAWLTDRFTKHHFTIERRIDHPQGVFYALTTDPSDTTDRSIHNRFGNILVHGELVDTSISLEDKARDILGENRIDELRTLEGSFVIVQVNDASPQVRVINDRHGQFRIFYSLVEGRLIISSRFLLLLDVLEKKTIHPPGLASFLLFGYPLEQDTLVKEVSILPPGSILSYEQGTISVNQYCDYLTHEPFDQRSLDELTETLGDLFGKAVEKRINYDTKHLVLISGGLDSRAILAETMTHCSTKDIVTASYGENTSYDARIAHDIAEAYALDHVHLQNHLDDFEDQYMMSLDFVDGMIDATPYYPLPLYRLLEKQSRSILSGLMGGELMGPLIFSKIQKNMEKHIGQRTGKKDLLFYHHIINDIKSVRSVLHKTRFSVDSLTTSFDQSVGDIDAISDDAFYQFCAAWMYRNETYKYTSYCNLRWPHLFTYHTPFYDHDLMDFMFTVPPDYRVDKTLYKHMVSVRYPELFSIPTKNTFGLPLASSRTRILLRRIMLGSLTRINRISTKIMKRNLFLDPLENYVDYDDLIRIDKTYRSFVKKHLDQVKCYPYFDAIGIDRIWENHLSGRGNYAYLFGLLVSFDLLMKHYISTGKNDGILKIDEEIVEER